MKALLEKFIASIDKAQGGINVKTPDLSCIGGCLNIIIQMNSFLSCLQSDLSS